MYRIQENSGNNGNSSFGADQGKQQLVNFIYKHIDLSRFRYDSLEVESELPQLISKQYFVSANFSGSNCLLVFAKIKDRFHTFLVDRKTLSYSLQKVKIQNVKITNVNIKIKNSNIYNGTIFDGTYVQGKNEKTFIITDVYTFEGRDLTKSQLDSKLLTILTYLQSNYVPDKSSDLSITVNKIYELEKTEHLINNVVPKIRNFLVRGICFYPEMSGTKLLFRFDNDIVKQEGDQQYQQYQKPAQNNYNNYNGSQKFRQNEESIGSTGSDSNSPNVKQKPQVISKAPEIKKVIKTFYIPKAGKSDESYVFEMKKTESVDVYKLNALDTVIKDSKTLLKRKQIGLAYVPNANRSKWCKETVGDTEAGVFVHCKYYSDKFKWEPILIANSKKPSFIDDFDTKVMDQ
jgi:hypothetical protein